MAAELGASAVRNGLFPVWILPGSTNHPSKTGKTLPYSQTLRDASRAIPPPLNKGRGVAETFALNVWGLLVLKGFSQSKLRSFPILINSAFTSWHVGVRPRPAQRGGSALHGHRGR